MISKLIKAFRNIGQPIKLLNAIGAKVAFHYQWTWLPSLPVNIDIEPINACNFSCRHCQVTHWDKSHAQLTEDAFGQILDQFPNAIQVKLQGMGEPFLNKQLVPMLVEGEKRGLKMTVITNGSVCTDAVLQQIVSLRNTTIVFSIDGATTTTFEKMRPGSQFERIKSNIKQIIKLRHANRQPSIAAWTVLTRDNFHEAAEIVKLAKELGLDGITLQPVMTDWGRNEMKVLVEPLKVDPISNALIAALENAQRVAKDISVPLTIARYDGNHLFSKENSYPWPWTGSYIAANGDVVPCCIVANSDVVKLGNVFDKPFKQIWNSQEYQDLREKISRQNLPTYCKGCYGEPR